MLTAQVEAWSACLPELKALFPAHYETLSSHKGRFPLAPDFARYARIEATGELVLVTLREAGRLVGYWTQSVGPGLHYRDCLTALFDMWWIEPGTNPAGVLILARAVERELTRRGVALWFAGEKAAHPRERLYEAMGMSMVERTWAKWLPRQ